MLAPLPPHQTMNPEPLIPDFAGKRGGGGTPVSRFGRNWDREIPRFPIRPGTGIGVTVPPAGGAAGRGFPHWPMPVRYDVWGGALRIPKHPKMLVWGICRHAQCCDTDCWHALGSHMVGLMSAA